MKAQKNPPKVTLAQAITGYMLNIQGRRLSPTPSATIFRINEYP